MTVSETTLRRLHREARVNVPFEEWARPTLAELAENIAENISAGMAATDRLTLDENVTPETAAARLVEIKAKKWITEEEEQWAIRARRTGLLPPLTLEEVTAKKRHDDIVSEAVFADPRRPMTGAERAWIARMRKKGLLLPPIKAPDPIRPDPFGDSSTDRAGWRSARRTMARRRHLEWLAQQPPEVQAQQAAVRRFNYLFNAWEQFERAWRNAPPENKRQMLTNSLIVEDIAAIHNEIRSLKAGDGL